MSGSRDRLKNYEENRLVIDDVFSDVSFGQSGFKAGLKKYPNDSSYVELEDLTKWDICNGNLLLFWNCQGFRSAKCSLLWTMECLKSQPLFVGLCETFLSDENLNVMDFSVPGYRVEYKGRSFMQRGGLAALIRSDVDYEVRHDFSLWLEGKLKTLFIEIRSSWSEKLLFGIM